MRKRISAATLAVARATANAHPQSRKSSGSTPVVQPPRSSREPGLPPLFQSVDPSAVFSEENRGEE